MHPRRSPSLAAQGFASVDILARERLNRNGSFSQLPIQNDDVDVVVKCSVTCNFRNISNSRDDARRTFRQERRQLKSLTLQKSNGVRRCFRDCRQEHVLLISNSTVVSPSFVPKGRGPYPVTALLQQPCGRTPGLRSPTDAENAASELCSSRRRGIQSSFAEQWRTGGTGR